jgi:hypothetical protein
MYSREQYESDMADIEAIRVAARRKFLRVQLLRADKNQHAADGHPGNVLPCAYCMFAEEAVKKLNMDGHRYKAIDDKCDYLEQGFTERLRALARFLGEQDVANRFAKNCKILGHKCSNPKACGCSCHGRRVLQWKKG